MIFCLADVLDADGLAIVRRAFDEAPLRPGSETAGWHARLVKNNRQLTGGSTATEAAADAVVTGLMAHDIFRSAILPRTVRPPLFSLYEPTMAYGSHVDDAVMGDPPVRADVSITVFVDPPESYDGGELIMDSTAGDQAFKLEAGHALIYPSTTLHRVDPVTRGRRRVAVTWAQSLVRDVAKREILFDLDQSRRRIFAESGKTETFDRLAKAYANLMRLWAEV